MRAAPQPTVRLSKPAGAGNTPPLAPATSPTSDHARQLVLLDAAAAGLREALEALLVEHDCPQDGDCRPWCAPCRAIAAMSATDAGMHVLEQLDAYRLLPSGSARGLGCTSGRGSATRSPTSTRSSEAPMPELPVLCPWCGAHNDLHDGVTSEQVPEAGDVSVCWSCKRIGVFDAAGADLTLRRPTDEELERFRTHPHYSPLMQAIREASVVDEAITMFRHGARGG